MNQARPGLFTPIRIGQRQLRNRIVFLPHATGQGVDGLPSEGHAAYYARRAEGGVAMIVSEATPVHVASLGRPTHVKGYDPRIAAPARMVSDAVHQHGAVILAQISHRGLAANPLYSGRPVWAPSPSRSPHTGETAHALTLRDIDEVVAGFEQTARNFIDGGYDGVEVHATHGHLLNSFVSSKLNWRTDDYGGPIENRLRLLLRVLEALRKLPLGILGIRIGQPAWNTGPDAADAPAMIRAIEPYVDYISVTGGTQATKHLNMGDFYSRPGYMLELAKQVKTLTSKPVIAAGQLNDPDMASSVIQEGMADLLGMARGLICDPDWANKVEQRQSDSLRRCIACNNCLERVDSGVTIGCVYNPLTGREAILVRTPPARSGAAGRKVLVVGGGPAGMQAALRAQEWGMQVTLVEAKPALGGQVPLAASVPGRSAFAQVSDHLQRQLAHSDVVIRTGTRLSPQSPELAGLDGIIVATGSTPAGIIPSPSIAVPRYRAVDVIADPSLPRGKRALVSVEDGMPAGPGVAELLCSRGLDVHVVVNAGEIGLALPENNRLSLMGRMFQLPLNWHFHGVLVSVDAAGKAIVSVRGEQNREIPDVDFVVHATTGTADAELMQSLERDPALHLAMAGDCVAPRNIFSAVREGFDAADELARQFSA